MKYGQLEIYVTVVANAYGQLLSTRVTLFILFTCSLFFFQLIIKFKRNLILKVIFYKSMIENAKWTRLSICVGQVQVFICYLYACLFGNVFRRKRRKANVTYYVVQTRLSKLLFDHYSFGFVSVLYLFCIILF
jgi:hypothetical protein